MNLLRLFTLLFLNVALTAYSSTAQDVKLKKQRKSPSAFINIAHQDAKSEGINANTAKQFENSIQTFGDRDLVEDMIVRTFLNSNLGKSAPIVFDSVYAQIASECPPVNRFVYINPYLITYYSIFSFVKNKGGNSESAFQEYLKWQKLNLPNAPVGINELASDVDEISVLNSTQNWVLKYPEEFNLALSIYQKDYLDFAKEKKRKVSDEELFRTTLNYAGRFSDEELDELINFSIPLENVEQTVISSNEFMREHTEQFINEAYETLFMRSPSKDEMEFLLSFIKSNLTLTPKMFYYAMMTSNEYKWY